MHIKNNIKKTILDWLFGKITPGALCRIDARELLQIVFYFGLEAHLLWRLNQLMARAEKYPEPLQLIRANLHRRCVFNAANNLRMDVEVRGLCRALETEGIPVMLLKGAALRARYPDLAGRPQCDTDIMVKREDLERAEAVLESAGFQVDEKVYTRQEYLEHHFDLRMIRDQHPVELHWVISNDCRPDAMDGAWSRAELVDWGGAPAWLPSLEDQLLFSQVHICRHIFSRSLRWIGDLVFELEHWPDLLARTEKIAGDCPRKMTIAPLEVARELGWRPRAHQNEGLPEISGTDRYLLGVLARSIIWGDDALGFPSEYWGFALGRWFNNENSSLFRELIRVLGRKLTGQPVRPWNY
jgi:hypothetical protein